MGESRHEGNRWCLTQAPSDHRVPDVVDSGDVGNERWCEFSDDDDRSEWTEGVWRRGDSFGARGVKGFAV